MSAKTSDWRPGPTVCRCCLSEGCYKDISTEYFWMGKREVYAEMLSDTLNVTIAYSKSGPNSNSRLICEPCISRLRDAHDFKRQVLECEKTFMQYLDPGSENVQKEMELSFEEVKVERVKQEKKVSDDEDMDDRVDFVVNDDSDDELDNEPLMKLASKVPKKEKEMDLLDLLDNSQITVKRKSTASTSKSKEPPAKKAKKREITIKPSASKATASKTVEKKKKGSPASPQAPAPTDDGPRTSAWIITAPERENAATFIQFTTVIPFTALQGSYKCFYCEEIFTELHSALQHTKTHAIPSRSSLLDTYIKNGKRVIKVDASGLKCRICELKYTELDDIRTHLITVHKKAFSKAGNGLMPYNLTTPSGNVACHKCGLEFTTFFSLNRHMNVHDNLVCETCGLGFVSHQRLRSHRIVHQNGNHKCDQCQRVFSTKMKLRCHATRHHEQTNVKRLKPNKCPHCLERFSEHYQKMLHMREAHGITFKFECQTCKAEFPNKMALTEHTRKVHIQNIVCKICGKCFGTPGALRRHMRGHTGERNFICAVCQKAYMHEKQIRMHMKTHGYKVTCLKCGNGFLDKADLTKHKRQWHADQSRFKSASLD